ncbi:MAG TPA: hypothetical protein PKM88_03210 [bacterium]|nr:hypothetical protein [bacterium]
MTELANGFQTIRGSDVDRNGMYLELIDSETRNEFAAIFYSDDTHKMTLSLFRKDIPLEVIEKFIEKAKTDLPPMKK